MVAWVVVGLLLIAALLALFLDFVPRDVCDPQGASRCESPPAACHWKAWTLLVAAIGAGMIAYVLQGLHRTSDNRR